jgi:hypothetical protein
MADLRRSLTGRPARNYNRILCMTAVVAAGLAGLVSPAAASATAPQASLYLTPATGSPKVGDELDVQIRINTGSQQTNAVQANLTYPSGQLSVLGFDNSTRAMLETSTRSPGRYTPSLPIHRFQALLRFDPALNTNQLATCGPVAREMLQAAGSAHRP